MTGIQCGLCEKNYSIQEFCEIKKCTCGCDFENETWQILTRKQDYVISTTHLGIGMLNNLDLFDHSHDNFYETAIFKFENDQVNFHKPLGFQSRYKTKEDAIEGHKLAFDKLEMILLNPDKYPKGIISLMVDWIEASRDASITQQKKDMR